MTTVTFKNVYVLSKAVVVGSQEKAGPLGQYFPYVCDDLYAMENSFEKGERKMMKQAIDLALKQAQLSPSHLDLAIGGDLMNQNATSNYVAAELSCPFVSVYGACSNSALVMGEGAIAIEHLKMKHVLAFTGSHIATAERQFRYPNEYGIQKKETSTTTVTGCGAVVLSSTFTSIRLTHFTLGRVIDWQFNDVNDMGKAMVPAAYETLLTHFKDTQRTFDDYDLIVTGDLGKSGYAMFCECVLNQRFQLENKLNDCGIMIYDLNHQEVFCGGSGCGCSMVVTLGKLLHDLENKKMKRFLLIATGCVHSPTLIQQHENIPTIAHAICFERS